MGFLASLSRIKIYAALFVVAVFVSGFAYIKIQALQINIAQQSAKSAEQERDIYKENYSSLYNSFADEKKRIEQLEHARRKIAGDLSKSKRQFKSALRQAAQQSKEGGAQLEKANADINTAFSGLLKQFDAATE